MPYTPKLPLGGIRCQATGESCKNHNCFYYILIMLTAYCSSLTYHVSFHPSISGEYALAEYTEVKAVTVKLSETL